MLDCKFFIRSSDAKNILKYDMNFLKYLCFKVKERLNLKNNIVTKINLVINSLHIPVNIDY